jgi:hypothetical protein
MRGKTLTVSPTSVLFNWLAAAPEVTSSSSRPASARARVA